MHEEDLEQEGLATSIVDSGLKVHRTLGPGLLERAYEQCLCHELGARGLVVHRQVVLPTVYDGVTLDGGYEIDS